MEEAPDGRPLSVHLRRAVKLVASIEDTWRIDDEWWREKPISRLYYRVTLEDGRPITLFKDLTSNRWYRQES